MTTDKKCFMSAFVLCALCACVGCARAGAQVVKGIKHTIQAASKESNSFSRGVAEQGFNAEVKYMAQTASKESNAASRIATEKNSNVVTKGGTGGSRTVDFPNISASDITSLLKSIRSNSKVSQEALARMEVIASYVVVYDNMFACNDLTVQTDGNWIMYFNRAYQTINFELALLSEAEGLGAVNLTAFPLVRFDPNMLRAQDARCYQYPEDFTAAFYRLKSALNQLGVSTQEYWQFGQPGLQNYQIARLTVDESWKNLINVVAKYR